MKCVDANQVHRIIDTCTKSFLERVEHITEKRDYNSWRSEQPGFPALRIANDEYYVYKHYERYLEGLVRNNLVNPLLRELLAAHDIEAEFLIDEDDRHIGCTNEDIEQLTDIPVEFILSDGGSRIGCRYTEPYVVSDLLITLFDFVPEENREGFDVDGFVLSHLLRHYSIDCFMVIDWSDLAKHGQSTDGTCPHSRYPEMIKRETAGSFLRLFFPEDICCLISEKLLAAVNEANLMIGFQTIPNLSLAYRSDFNAEVIERIKGFRELDKCYRPKPDATDAAINQSRLSDIDRDYLDRVFFDEGLCRSLIGHEDFARCFITSEYLHDVFINGGHFDYTAVACGYLKAVEQLAHRLMELTLGLDDNEGLQIDCVNGTPDELRAPHANRVPFNVDNAQYFKTELGSLINFLCNNRNNHWALTKNGRDYTYKCLKAFKDDSRNELFHKHNIDDYAEIERIRFNSMLAMYLLIGGYVTANDIDSRCDLLGADKGYYDALYFDLRDAIAHPLKGVMLKFEGAETIKAIPFYHQEKISYNSIGQVQASIRFVRVEEFVRVESEDYFDNVSEEDTVVVSRDNIPVEVTLVRKDGDTILLYKRSTRI